MHEKASNRNWFQMTEEEKEAIQRIAGSSDHGISLKAKNVISLVNGNMFNFVNRPVNMTSIAQKQYIGKSSDEINSEDLIHVNYIQNTKNIMVTQHELGDTYKVYNTIGQQMLSGVLNDQMSLISVSDLIPGLYTITIDSKQKSSIHDKFVVQ